MLGSDPGGDVRERASLEVVVEVTDKPWLLPVDAVLLSVGEVLGSLGRQFAAHFPDAGLDQMSFSKVTPSSPRVVRLPRPQNEPGPRFVVLVTPHTRGMGSPTDDSIAVATYSGVQKVIAAGATSVGVPMIATGSIGRSASTVAPVAVPAALRAAVEPLRRLVFIALSDAYAAPIRAALGRPSPIASSAPPFVEDEEPEDEEPEVPVTARLAGGMTSDHVDPRCGIALEKDHLGVAPYVSMLASLITDRQTSVPLSVGIFGAWGSGKSYFMGLLRTQVEQLAKSREPGYCAEVAQISFNAWHYADTNIWASLGDEIFRQLLGPDPSGEDRRRALRDEMADRMDQRRELDALASSARAAAASAKAQVEHAATMREVRIRELLAVLRRSPEVARLVRSSWRRLGITDEADQVRLFGRQLGGVVSEAEALRRSPRDRLGRLALGVSALVLATFAVVAWAAPDIRSWARSLFAAVAVFSGGGVFLMTRARVGLRSLNALSEDIQSGLRASGAAKPSGDLKGAIDALRSAEAEQQVAEARLNDVVARLGEITWQLAELQPGQRWYGFLSERAASQAYTGNLGLLSVIRKDFEQLIEIIADARTELEGRDDALDVVRPPERIVLYIDDLDRCGSQQVVNVLQAVHLLLALDLFVVVIGVDPRWLLRSLDSQYADVMEAGGADEAGDVRGAADDYLEKIINVPFALPHMPRGSVGRMVEALDDFGAGADTGESAGSSDARVVRQAGSSADRSGTTERSFSWIDDGSVVGARLRRSPVVVPPRPLTAAERSLLARLDPFVRSPREARRVINLYRMLRSTRDFSGASHFLGEEGGPGEYQAAMALLGVLNFRPRLLVPFLDAQPQLSLGEERDWDVRGGLLARPADTKWLEFLSDLRPENGNNRIVGALDDRSGAAWGRLFEALSTLSADVTMRNLDLSSFQMWAPRVRRFASVDR